MDQMQQPFMPLERDNAAPGDTRGNAYRQQRMTGQERPTGQTGRVPVPQQMRNTDFPQRNNRSMGQTRREEDNAESLLNRMEHIVGTARKLPLTSQVTVDRDEMLFLIKMVREGLPEELRQAKWLLMQNRQLIAEARKEAESIRHDAEQQMARMIDENEITQKAKEVASHIVSEAEATKQQIQQQTVDYVREMFDLVEKKLTDTLLQIQKSKKNLEP